MPQNPEAMAMAKPEVMATQLVPDAAPPAASCAKAAGATNANANSTSHIIANFFILLLLRYEIAARRWFPDILVQPGSRETAEHAPMRPNRKRISALPPPRRRRK